MQLNDLPMEVLHHIAVTLDTDNINRWRRVCKLWYDIACDPGFNQARYHNIYSTMPVSNYTRRVQRIDRGLRDGKKVETVLKFGLELQLSPQIIKQSTDYYTLWAQTGVHMWQYLRACEEHKARVILFGCLMVDNIILPMALYQYLVPLYADAYASYARACTPANAIYLDQLELYTQRQPYDYLRCIHHKAHNILATLTPLVIDHTNALTIANVIIDTNINSKRVARYVYQQLGVRLTLQVCIELLKLCKLPYVQLVIRLYRCARPAMSAIQVTNFVVSHIRNNNPHILLLWNSVLTPQDVCVNRVIHPPLDYTCLTPWYLHIAYKPGMTQPYHVQLTATCKVPHAEVDVDHEMYTITNRGPPILIYGSFPFTIYGDTRDRDIQKLKLKPGKEVSIFIRDDNLVYATNMY